MEVGKETTDIAAQLTAEALKESIKLTGMLTGKSAQFVLETIIEKYKQNRDILKPGNTNLEKLLRSQKALKMVDMDQDDLQVFSERATRFGLTFAVVSEDKSNHIIFKEEDTPFMQKVLEITMEKKLERQKDLEYDDKLKQFIETLKTKSDEEKNVEDTKPDTSSVEDPAAETTASKEDTLDSKEALASKESVNSEDQTPNQQEVIDKKLAAEQFAADKKDIDIPNNEITVKSHQENNKDNKKKKDLSENKDNRISIRQELAKTTIPAESKKSKAPTKVKSAKENVRG